MNKKRVFALSIVLLLIVATLLSPFFDVKIVISFSCLILLMLAYYLYKAKIGQELVVALLMALIITSYYNYNYTSLNLSLGRINLFPLITWTTGLIILREIYENLKYKHKFLLSCLIYLVVLILLEYAGYYLLNIKLNWNYSGLFGLGIIHGPIFLKIFYIFAGPLYLAITDYLKLKYI